MCRGDGLFALSMFLHGSLRLLATLHRDLLVETEIVIATQARLVQSLGLVGLKVLTKR